MREDVNQVVNENKDFLREGLTLQSHCKAGSISLNMPQKTMNICLSASLIQQNSLGS